uniref:Helicase ATP-binding domain-containing protein n=1 Tax=Wuchereria bancrofti TaxID=6293 RepID=A0A1I8EU86_WUCBA
MSLEVISVDLLEREKKRMIPSSIRTQRELLPVYQYRDQLIDTIRNNSVTIVKGETGCGKSTQNYDFNGKVCQTLYKQLSWCRTRQISAIALAERIADERGEQLGVSVGYAT